MTNWLRRWWNGSPHAPISKTTRRTRLDLESMEAREVPAALAGNGIALALYTGSTDTAVQVVNPSVGTTLYKSFPGFRGPIIAAAGDVNGDGVADAIVGAQNSGGLVAVFDGKSGGLIGAGNVFPGFTGKVNVGVADLNGDGYAEVLVTADAPGAPVRAFDVRDGLSAGFNAFPGFKGQISVTGADLNGDGRDEIVVGAGGQGVGGRVAAFNVDGSVFNPGGPLYAGFNGGISLAAGDLNGDGRDDVVLGSGPGPGGGEVKVISGATGALLADFVPFASRATNGVSVYVADGNGDGRLDLFVALQGSGYPSLVGLNSATGRYLAGTGFGGGDGTYSGYDSGSSGDVGSYPDNSYYSSPDYGYYPSSDSGGYSGYSGGDSGYSGGDYSGGDYYGGDYSGGDYGGGGDFGDDYGGGGDF